MISQLAARAAHPVTTYPSYRENLWKGAGGDMATAHLAFDFGASNGRLMLGTYDGSKIALEEIHRFPNEPVWFRGRYYLDFLRLFHEMKVGLKKVAQRGIKVHSIGIDTWGRFWSLRQTRPSSC